MQDRISAYPGRVKLTPVAGQADTYDLTRADQPTQEGTPLNKASLLSDSTVNTWQSGHPWGKENAAVTPDDVLARIAYLRGQAGGIATLDAAGKLMESQQPDPTPVETSGTSLNLTSYDYAFSGTRKTATITSLPSSGVSNGIYFYGSAWANGEQMSAGDVIKLTNSSGKTIQLNTAQSSMTYSGNVLTITPHGYRDTNCIGICLRFLRTGSYSRPFITKLYQ